MHRVEGTLEDLPPLQVRRLRDLDLREAPAEGRPAAITSASGLWRRGDNVYVVADALRSLGHFRLSQAGPGELLRVLEDPREDPTAKADLESLTMLPPSRRRPFGTLLGLGSGSSPGRDRGFAWALGPAGEPEGEPRPIDLGPLYDRVRDALGHLNVEGASVMGDRLWLLHRGSSGGGPSAVAEVDLADVRTSLDEDGRLDAHELAALRHYALGELEGVPLHFSDATPIGDGVLVFTASAEDDEGTIRGSVLGTVALDGDVRRLRTIDRTWKVEGVHASLDTGVLDLLLVCDQDDDEPSPLLASAMPLDAAADGAVGG